MNHIYYDWKQTELQTLLNDSDVVVRYTGFDALLDKLNKVPHKLIGESSMESYDPVRKAHVIARCKAEGHILRCIKPTHTPRHRRAMGLENKTDDNDVRAIRDMYLTGMHFQEPIVFNPASEYALKHKAMRTEIRDLRRIRYIDLKKNGEPKKTPITAKDKLAMVIRDQLPKDAQYHTLCTIAAVAMAAKYANNTKEFDRLAGLHGNGYKSQVRADLMYHNWSKKLEVGGIAFTDWRREIRRLYHLIKTIYNQQGLTVCSQT